MSRNGTASIRKKIFLVFALIFSLFLLGTCITAYNLINTSNRLKNLISMHEIEDIRQELFSSVLKVSSYVFASPDVFTEHLDEIIANTNTMHDAVRRCSDCHHVPEQQKKLDETREQVELFEQQLSYLITIVSGKERRQAQQTEVYNSSTRILDRVQSMVSQAAATIDQRTVEAMDELRMSYLLVAATLLLTFTLFVLISNYLVKNITEPIDILVQSTRRIAEGEWGFQTDFQATGEFRELVESFNSMSESLAMKREQEQIHLQKLKDTQKQLIEAEKLSALGTMAGGIAHDFNNILCGMIGHLNILARQIPPNEAYRKTIETIEKAGFRAADLVKQLLTFARQKPMERQTIYINKCITDVALLIETTLDKRIRLALDLDEDLPAVRGDGAQLEQVVINLCINSRDAMPEGGELVIRTEVFEPDTEFCDQHRDAQERAYVLMTVRDTGCGINEKILPRIFDPFFTTKDVGKGTGLGLAMVYGIVQNHDGFCTIESAPALGTTVRIYLPAVEGEAKEVVLCGPEDTPAGKTIMIVDDEPMVVAMLRNHLENLGCNVLTAANGQMAVDLLKEKRDEIDLIILDINMPVMCGRDAYHQFVSIRPDIKVLVSTGYVMSEDTREVLNMGAQGFLQKPYRMEDLNTRLMEIFKEEPGR